MGESGGTLRRDGAGRRVCVDCGAFLSRSNSGERCHSCQRHLYRGGVVPPAVPEEFWRTEDMRAALAARHMGRVLRAFRRHPFHDRVIPQEVAGWWFGISQAQVCRLERENIRTTQNLDTLIVYARTLGIPQEYLWFDLPGQQRTTEYEDINDNHGDNKHRQTEYSVDDAHCGASTFSGWFSFAPHQYDGQRSIGREEVEIVQEMVKTFRHLDNRYGGGRARSMVATYLSSEVAQILHSDRIRDSVRQALIGAVADLNHLAGWIAYDVGDSKSGSTHLRQALRFSRQISDLARASEMLATMSHQSAFFQSADLAVNFARAAKYDAERSGIRMLVAESAVMEAHGLALQGRREDCINALTDAETAFSEGQARERPDWLDYFNEAYLSAKFAHCLRALQMFDDAEQFARRSLEMSDGYDRGRVFNNVLLASILVERGELEESCSVAALALDAARRIQSTRASMYFADLAHRLDPYKSVPCARTLLDRTTEMGIVPSRM